MKRLTLLLVAALAACSPAPEPEKPVITVHADSALTEVFTRVGKEFEDTQGVRVKFLFGASSALEKQLDGVDLYASASPDNMKYESKVFALNRLVLAIGKDNPKNVRFSPEWNPQTTFAMCVEEAPCGAAARLALANARFREGTPAPKAVGQDVKETFAKLEAGEVDSAFVYATDVKPERGFFTVPVRVSDQPPAAAVLKFPVALLSGTPEAKKFYNFLFTERARAALTDAGFELP